MSWKWLIFKSGCACIVSYLYLLVGVYQLVLFIGMSDPRTYICGEFGLCVVGCCCEVLSAYCPFIVTIIVHCVSCKNANTNKAECWPSSCMDVTWLCP